VPQGSERGVVREQRRHGDHGSKFRRHASRVSRLPRGGVPSLHASQGLRRHRREAAAEGLAPDEVLRKGRPAFSSHLIRAPPGRGAPNRRGTRARALLPGSVPSSVVCPATIPLGDDAGSARPPARNLIFPGRVLGRNPRNRHFAHGAFSCVSPSCTLLRGCACSRPRRNADRSVPSLLSVRDCRWGNIASAFVVLLQGPVSRAYPSTTWTRCSEPSSDKGTSASPGRWSRISRSCSSTTWKLSRNHSSASVISRFAPTASTTL